MVVWQTTAAAERFGISTHLFHQSRLAREHLVQIAGHGFEAVELFATRAQGRLAAVSPRC